MQLVACYYAFFLQYRPHYDSFCLSISPLFGQFVCPLFFVSLSLLRNRTFKIQLRFSTGEPMAYFQILSFTSPRRKIILGFLFFFSSLTALFLPLPFCSFSLLFLSLLFGYFLYWWAASKVSYVGTTVLCSASVTVCWRWRLRRDECNWPRGQWRPRVQGGPKMAKFLHTL